MMPMQISKRVGCLVGLGLLAMAGCVQAQSAVQSTPFGELRIERHVRPEQPFSVIGPRGAMLGRQDGTFEAWLFPWKVLSGMRMTVEMHDYPVPIDVNAQAAAIDVEPDHTTITYSHANFTIRQTMIAPRSAEPDTGVLVLYEMEAVRPMTVTFTFDPVMQRMWPADSPPAPSPEWVKNSGGSGFYILHLAFPDQAAALAIPGAEPGILQPYQERPQHWPLQFVLHFDPKEIGKVYPLVITVANTPADATKEALRQRIAELESRASAVRAANRRAYADYLEKATAIDTPDGGLNAAFGWAEAAIEQLRIAVIGTNEQALTAGFIGSGDVTRPGFGWFFGRDALWSLYAVNSYGDFDTTKDEIAFLLARQRDDGKIMHEYSQTARMVQWGELPYEYAAADATPLLQMAVDDYLKISGDAAFVSSIWPHLESAWRFETTHDSDGDGIYDNSQGTGWVESWIPKMPHQEIYLAALDEQATLAFADLARATGHGDVADQAKERAARIAATIEKEYYQADSQEYAFSWTPEGPDKTVTAFPSVAWWDGTYRLEHPDKLLQEFAGADLSTDWGLRDVSNRTSFYDPISYHQGSVWPLYTGWTSVAEYRAGNPLSAYVHLMQNANLTWEQDPGDVTELLSGQFYQALGRSTAHQLWSSAMVISPVLRGLFGLEWNAAAQTLTITPHLPPDWTDAKIRRLPFGNRRIDLSFRREERILLVQASDPRVHLASRIAGSEEKNAVLRLPLPAVEVGITERLPEIGMQTTQMKVLSETYSDHGVALELSAPAGTTQMLSVRENISSPRLHTSDGKLSAVDAGARLWTIQFPDSGTDYIEKRVTLAW